MTTATRMEPNRAFHDVRHCILGILVLAFDPHCPPADLQVDLFTAYFTLGG
jgi:hypothetical protein